MNLEDVPAPSISAHDHNWFGDIRLKPARVVRPERVEDVVRVVRDRERFPTPIRAAGSSHSMTRCVVAGGGTLLDMRGMSRVLEIGADTVTVEAGSLYIDVAEALRKRGLEFYINFEIGTLTMGAAACTHTKDSSFAGEFGQLSAYCVGMKVVTATGDVVEVDEDDPDLLRVLRTSYGLLGIVCEATFRVRPIRPLAFDHLTLTMDQFEDLLPALESRREAHMYYVFPFQDRVTVERRWYCDDGTARPSRAWRLRNLTQATIGPAVARAISRWAPGAWLRNRLLKVNLAVFWLLLSRLRSSHSSALDQIIRYPEAGGWSRYTFSIWAFPESRFPAVLREYVRFCERHEAEHGYRCEMPTVGYRIARDPTSLLSYAPDRPVMTLDPVATGERGWKMFLDEFNEFGSRNGGMPLLNQTPRLRPGQARQAFGSRFDDMVDVRHQWDPDDRLLAPYFERFLSQP